MITGSGQIVARRAVTTFSSHAARQLFPPTSLYSPLSSISWDRPECCKGKRHTSTFSGNPEEQFVGSKAESAIFVKTKLEGSPNGGHQMDDVPDSKFERGEGTSASGPQWFLDRESVVSQGSSLNAEEAAFMRLSGQEALQSDIQAILEGCENANELLMASEVASDVLNDTLPQDECLVHLDEASNVIIEQSDAGKQSHSDRDFIAQGIIVARLTCAFLHVGDTRSAFEMMTKVNSLRMAHSTRHLPVYLWRSLIEKAAMDPNLVIELFEAARSILENSDKEVEIFSDQWVMHARCEALVRLGDEGHVGEERARLVDEYWKEYERFGVVAPRSLFEYLLEVHVRRRNVMLARKTIRAMKDRGYRADVATWLVLLRAHPSLRPAVAELIDELDSLSDETKDSSAEGFEEWRSKTPAHVLQKVVEHVSRQNDVRSVILALRLFGAPTGSQMSTASSFRPTSTTYLAVAKMFATLDRLNHAMRFVSLAFDATSKERLDNVEGARLPSEDEVKTTLLIRVMTGFGSKHRPDEVLALAALATDLHHEELRGRAEQLAERYPILERVRGTVRRSCKVYGRMLRSASELNSDKVPVVARAILLDLFANGKEVDRSVRNGLCHVLMATTRHMNWRHLVRHLEKLTSIPESDPNRGKDAESMALFLKAFERHGLGDRYVIATRKGSTPSRVEHPSHEWVRDADNSAHSSTLAAQGHSQMPEEQSAAERELDLSFRLSAAAYAMRLRVYAVLRRDHASAEAIYRSMVKHGVEPNMLHIAPIIEGLVSCDRIDEARAVQRGASRVLGKDVTRRVHSAIARGYARRGAWGEVRMELGRMQKMNMKPDHTLLGMLAAAERDELGGKSHGRKGLRSSLEGGGGSQERQVYGTILGRSVLAGNEEKNEWRRRPSVETVTSIFSTLMNRQQFLDAQRFLARQDARLRSDKVLMDVLRRAHNIILKARDRRWERVDSGQADEETRSKFTDLGQALKLSRHNRRKLSKLSPDHMERESREIRARREVLELIVDSVGSNRLRNEVQRQ